MGRVVPLNAGRNLLTRMLDLERSAGYQVDQQARMNLHLVPQYGGTVGGVRLSALRDVGGWREDTLTEDTDLTYRLLLRGWETVYQNRSECYEEVPEQWAVRIRQITRWSDGHNQAMRDHAGAVFRGHLRGNAQTLDALLLLGVYAVAPLTHGRLARGALSLVCRSQRLRLDRGDSRRVLQHPREFRGVLRGRGRGAARRLLTPDSVASAAARRLPREPGRRRARDAPGPSAAARAARVR